MTYYRDEFTDDGQPRSWHTRASNMRFDNGSPVRYPYTLTRGSLPTGSTDPISIGPSTLPPDFFELEPLPEPQPAEPDPRFTGSSGEGSRLERDKMRGERIFKVYKADCYPNINVTCLQIRPGRTVRDIDDPSYDGHGVSGHIVTEWSHLGELERCNAYIHDLELSHSQDRPRPLFDPSTELHQESNARFDINGNITRLELWLKPSTMGHDPHRPGETHNYPWFIYARDPVTPVHALEHYTPRRYPEPEHDQRSEDDGTANTASHSTDFTLPLRTLA